MKMFPCAALIALAMCSTATAQTPSVSIRIDTSLADTTLAILCTHQPIDEAAIRASPIVQAQVQHNSGLRAAATMDAYVAAQRAASNCQAPADDPFGIGDVIANPDVYRAKVAALRDQQEELAAAVAARLAPYVPEGETFEGQVILAVPYFSCGGFAANGHFFIDVRCMDQNIAADALALELNITHETFHVMQSRWFRPFDYGEIDSGREGVEAMFVRLVWEGSATHVAPPRLLPSTGGGPLTALGRRIYNWNDRRMALNFALLSILIDDVARAEDPNATFRQNATMAFNGSGYEEMGYHVGARMAGEIETAWGATALMCVLRLPVEQFVLAHDAVTAGRPDALRLSEAVVGHARDLGRRRPAADRFQRCRQ